MNPDDAHILVVDDDRRLCRLLQEYLLAQGFVVATAGSAAAAESMLKHLAFDLMIVDVMMPGEDGISFTRRIRRKAGIPIVMLTARGAGDDRIAGLENGADDYLPKPFEPRELVLRIQSVLRRNAAPPLPPAVAFGPFLFDAARMALTRDGEAVPLTSREAALLGVLASRPGTTLSRLQLSRRTGSGERSVDVQVARLRRKIERQPGQPRHLQTVWGEGYVLQAEEAPRPTDHPTGHPAAHTAGRPGAP